MYMYDKVLYMQVCMYSGVSVRGSQSRWKGTTGVDEKECVDH